MPDTAARAATAATFQRTHVLGNIEANGFQGQPYGRPCAIAQAPQCYIANVRQKRPVIHPVVLTSKCACAGAIETVLLANLTSNSVLIQNIIDQNNLLNREIDFAIERPDTVVQDCEVRCLVSY